MLHKSSLPENAFGLNGEPPHGKLLFRNSTCPLRMIVTERTKSQGKGNGSIYAFNSGIIWLLRTFAQAGEPILGPPNLIYLEVETIGLCTTK